MNSTHTFRKKDIDKIMPNTSGSLEDNKSNSFEIDFGSNKIVNKNSFTANDSTVLSGNIFNCMESELSDNDLIEIQTIPPRFKRDKKRNKEFKKSYRREISLERIQLAKEGNENKSSFENVNGDDTESEFGSYETPLTNEQLNIEECLFELDDYLEKMEKNEFQNEETYMNKSKIANNFTNGNGCSQFKRNSRYRNTIGCSIQSEEAEHTIMNSTHTFQKKDIDKFMPNISGSVEDNKSNSFESDFGPHKIVNKNSYPENHATVLSGNIFNCMESELSDNDLIEIQTIPPRFKHEKKRNKEFKKSYRKEISLERIQLGKEGNENKSSFENVNGDDTESEFVSYETPLTNEQLNIEECLFELDDYLEKMEKNEFQNEEPYKNKSKIAKNFTNGNGCSQFKRNSRYRNTIGCSIQSEEAGAKKSKTFKTPSIYATWSKQARRNSDYKQPNKEKMKFSKHLNLNITRESMQNLTCASESKALEQPANNIVSKLEGNSLSNTSSVQVLSNEQIFQNLMEQSEMCRSEFSNHRPRQIGRRAERCLILSTTDNNIDHNTGDDNLYNYRPVSAPASSSITLSELFSQNRMLLCGSNSSTAQSSCNTSPVSLDSISVSAESLAISNTVASSVNEQNIQQTTASGDIENVESAQNLNVTTHWPYKISRVLALISCTLGLFNISRFACLTINYGGNFLIQFLILSIFFGIPFLWLQMCLGAKIKAGPITMWKISPICSGIGISLMLVQYFITIYSSVVVVWLLVYIGDLFLHQSSYPWADSFRFTTPHNSTNISNNLTESVPDYFNIKVLQRLHILKVTGGNGVLLHINDRKIPNFIQQCTL